MKRQLGPILVVLVLFYGPAAWSQSGSPDTSQSGSTDTSQQQNSAPDGSQPQQQNGATDGSQSGSGSASQGSGTSSSQGSGTDSQGSSNSSSSGSSAGGFTPNGTVNAPYGGFTQPGSSDTQTGSQDTSQQTVTGPQSTFNHPEQLPPLKMLNEVTSNTGMGFTFATGVSTDSNAQGLATNDWQGSGTVSGTFGITQTRPKLLWGLNYSGGINQYFGGPTGYNTLTQAGVGNVLWQFAQRWQLKLQDSYIYSSDPFQPYITLTSLPTFNNPNPTIYYPQATFQTNTASAAITYSISPHDMLNFSGMENFYRYQGTAVLTFQNSFTWGGAAFYQHVFSPRISAGGGYEFTALDFGHGETRSGIQTFEGFVSYKLNPAITVSGWLGPELTNNKEIVPLFCIPGFGCYYQVVHTQDFNLAEGASFSWVAANNAFRAKYSHRVTNGGGLLGTVKLYMASLDYEQRFKGRYSLQASALYGNNVSISFFGQNEYLNSITSQVGISRFLTPSWSANAFYTVIEQRQNNVPGYTVPRFIDNRITLSLQYNWGHMLGR